MEYTLWSNKLYLVLLFARVRFMNLFENSWFVQPFAMVTATILE